MLCAITPTDHTTALAIRDTIETAGIVIQVLFSVFDFRRKISRSVNGRNISPSKKMLSECNLCLL